MGGVRQTAKHALRNFRPQTRESCQAVAQRLVLHFHAVGIDPALPHTSDEMCFGTYVSETTLGNMCEKIIHRLMTG